MKINFIKVGCENKSWSEEMETIDEVAIQRSIKKNGGLASQGISFNLNRAGTGTIYSGYHAVGLIEIEKEKTK